MKYNLFISCGHVEALHCKAFLLPTAIIEGKGLIPHGLFNDRLLHEGKDLAAWGKDLAVQGLYTESEASCRACGASGRACEAADSFLARKAPFMNPLSLNMVTKKPVFGLVS